MPFNIKFFYFSLPTLKRLPYKTHDLYKLKCVNMQFLSKSAIHELDFAKIIPVSWLHFFSCTKIGRYVWVQRELHEKINLGSFPVDHILCHLAHGICCQHSAVELPELCHPKSAQCQNWSMLGC